MKRGEKVRAIARYLTSRTGITPIHDVPHSNTLETPPAYAVMVTTDGSLQRFWATGYALERDLISFAVRFDNRLQQVDDSLVLMRLDNFVKLLAAYHESKEQ